MLTPRLAAAENDVPSKKNSDDKSVQSFESSVSSLNIANSISEQPNKKRSSSQGLDKHIKPEQEFMLFTQSKGKAVFPATAEHIQENFNISKREFK